MQPFLSMFIIGQQGSAGGMGPIVLWAGVLMVVVVVSAIALAWIRRRLVSAGVDDVGEGWSLHSLRELHGRGEMTGEEFERAKAALLEGMNKGECESPERTIAVDLTGDLLPRRLEDESGSSSPSGDSKVQ